MSPTELFEEFLTALHAGGHQTEEIALLRGMDEATQQEFGLGFAVVKTWLPRIEPELGITPRIGHVAEGPCLEIVPWKDQKLVLSAEGNSIFLMEDLGKRNQGGRPQLIAEREFRDAETAISSFIAACRRIYDHD